MAHRGSVAAIYLLAGIPEVVELGFNLLNWHLDTHVLMTLACLGTLAIGSAFEVAFSYTPSVLHQYCALSRHKENRWHSSLSTSMWEQSSLNKFLWSTQSNPDAHSVFLFESWQPYRHDHLVVWGYFLSRAHVLDGTCIQMSRMPFSCLESV